MVNHAEVSVYAHFAGAAQLSLGIVFLLAVLPKLRHPRTFVQSVVEYQILPTFIAYPVGMLLIPLELFLAIAFLTGSLITVALPLSMVLLGIFLTTVGINLWRGRRVACGCFGNTNEMISSRTVARLLLLLFVILLLLAFWYMGNAPVPSLMSLTTDGTMLINLLPTVLLALFLVLLGAWILSLPEIMLLIRYWRWRQPSSSNTEGEA